MEDLKTKIMKTIEDTYDFTSETIAEEIIALVRSDTQTLTCVYCGKAYPPGSPTHGSQVLTDHIRVCEKHPMRACEKALEFAEYMAKDAEALMAAMNEHAKAVDGIGDATSVEEERAANLLVEQKAEIQSECFSGLSSAIYEFRKRVPK